MFGVKAKVGTHTQQQHVDAASVIVGKAAAAVFALCSPVRDVVVVVGAALAWPRQASFSSLLVHLAFSQAQFCSQPERERREEKRSSLHSAVLYRTTRTHTGTHTQREDDDDRRNKTLFLFSGRIPPPAPFPCLFCARALNPIRS